MTSIEQHVISDLKAFESPQSFINYLQHLGIPNLPDRSTLSRAYNKIFRRAHLVRELLEKLGQGKVCFQYRKQDESEREAFGTLRAGIDPVFDAYVYKNDVKTNQHTDSLNFTYWDLKKKGFRTFSAARIVKIIAVAIPNYREINECHTDLTDPTDFTD